MACQPTFSPFLESLGIFVFLQALFRLSEDLEQNHELAFYLPHKIPDPPYLTDFEVCERNCEGP
jgi:hypothetical protein